jgi:hypothetical protein
MIHRDIKQYHFGRPQRSLPWTLALSSWLITTLNPVISGRLSSPRGLISFSTVLWQLNVEIQRNGVRDESMPR